MKQFLILAGLGLTFVGAAGKIAIKAVRYYKMQKFGIHINSDRAQFYKGAFDVPMTRNEACLILGVKTTANEEEIMKRYKTLIMINHPDRGGNPFFASKINQAKDLLLHKD